MFIPDEMFLVFVPTTICLGKKLPVSSDLIRNRSRPCDSVASRFRSAIDGLQRSLSSYGERLWPEKLFFGPRPRGR